jgi:DNA invertase Pin-like site-specific DNA recombinase
VFLVFAALAEFIRELIVSGIHEGLAAARARGRVGGRPTVVTARADRHGPHASLNRLCGKAHRRQLFVRLWHNAGDLYIVSSSTCVTDDQTTTP